MSSEVGHGRRRSHRAAVVYGAALLIAALALGACGSGDATPTPQYTAISLVATPWPSGTTGQYGLHIDPSLLGRLPPFVHAQPIVEDAASESVAMDNADLAKTFDGYAAASVGQIGEANWLALAIGHFTPAIQNSDSYPDMYSAWVSEYATGACSQASGVSTTSQVQIGDWDPVDQATCVGGLFVYTLSLGDGVVLSMFGGGSLDYGRLLIESIY